MSDSYAWIQKLQATEEGRAGGVAGWWEWGDGGGDHSWSCGCDFFNDWLRRGEEEVHCVSRSLAS